MWIPKYKYRLWNVETNKENKGKHSIEIEFGLEDTTDIEGKSCVTPMISGESGNCNNGEYMTHPAFISMGTNGLWVGKFEISKSGNQVQVKPGVTSWRNETVNSFFATLKSYNINLDSHMMKNTEWGAVAYLSHSIYGINDEVRINNNSSYLTGYAANTKDGASSKSDNQAYNTETGYLASTTGNITGIYDMSGGAGEYVSSYLDENMGSSGFTNINNYNQKYFDIYNSSSISTTYQNRILGDATGEMGPFSSYKNNWYADTSSFVNPNDPWFDRGGYYYSKASTGQFNFDPVIGKADLFCSARLVLAV